ncbi:MAG: aminotransferase class I/II-fold pyridoxal phosphate-dependent enzyme [Deltaproteobacteria bacterium]|nr:aminotransferase class I/II-fold pyridoxal phosphate-dependent enzyme [Deltaproteobacteria bacterium]
MSETFFKPANRTVGIGTSIFTEISALAVQHDAVNLGQGFPDFPAPEFVKAAARAAISENHNQYAPAAGLPRLRQAVSAHWERRHGMRWDAADEITVTQGATEGLFAAAMATLNPGDEAIVFEPFYDAYVPDIQMAGALPRFVRLQPPTWSFRTEDLVAAFSPRTKVIFLNTPHNPTGKVFTEQELDVIAELARKHNVIVIADEVYSELTFDAPHTPIATRPGMRERTITLDSIGKTFSVTGWKIGWALAAPALTKALRAAHQFITFCNATPFQVAAAYALEQAPAFGYYEELRKAYDVRRQALTAILNQANLAPLPIAGAYFLLCDIAKQPFATDTDFCKHLIEHVGVAAIPTSSFYANPRTAPKLARFCFAKSQAAFDEAAKRLAALPQQP